jgi:hypothetical protein
MTEVGILPSLPYKTLNQQKFSPQTQQRLFQKIIFIKILHKRLILLNDCKAVYAGLIIL